MRQRAKKNARRRRAQVLLVAPQGFEPRSSESESLVLPLNEGAPVTRTSAGVANKQNSLTDSYECTGHATSGQRLLLSNTR